MKLAQILVVKTINEPLELQIGTSSFWRDKSSPLEFILLATLFISRIFFNIGMKTTSRPGSRRLLGAKIG